MSAPPRTGPARTGPARRARLARARLQLVAGPETGGAGWAAAAQAALASGAVDILQLRLKAADDATLAAAVRAARPWCDAAGALLVLDDRVALAAACDADGAHVGEHDLPPGLARLLLGPERLLGLSTHGPDELRAARELPVDSVGLGPFFATASKDLERHPGGPALAAAALPAAGPLPVFAIGGITPASLPALVAAGVRRVAVGHAVLGAPDPAAAARALAALLPALPG